MRPDAASVRTAAGLLAGQVVRTPLVAAPALSRLTGAELWLKLENLQLSGSFKTRGALVRLLSLTAEERARGVVCMSAGNHAQGVAWHARSLGLPATIVMPRTTPFTKIERTEALGARVLLDGASLSEAEEAARRLAAEQGLTFIHPYDDPQVIAGQGTVGLEMLEDQPGLEVLLVPVGGGGLAAGICLAVKEAHPGVQVIGVETEAYPSMQAALTGGTARFGQQTLAEGIAVKRPGVLTTGILRELLDGMALVPEPLIERSVQLLIEEQKLVAEGAGAVPLAAILADPGRFAGRRVGLVISGGNMDPRLLAQVLLRGLARAGRMVRLRIEVPDHPGTLAQVARLIAEGDGNIIEIVHQRLFHDVPVKLTEMDVVLETTSQAHIDHIIQHLSAAGFPARQLGNTAGSC